MLAVLAGCGSGGSGGTPVDKNAPQDVTGTTTTPPVLAASIQLQVDNTQMPSSGANKVGLTAVVLSASKQAVSGRTVTFSTGGDATAFVNGNSSGSVSDSNGLVTASLNLGDDKTNRTITITAAADGASTTKTVDVTGTTITVSGNGSLAFNASTQLNFSVKDSAGAALPNVPVTVVSQNGNTVALTPLTGVTSGTGQVSATVTVINAGNDVITATAAGASTTQNLTVSADSFAFTAPTPAAGATSIEIPLRTAPAVSVNWTTNGAPNAGQQVYFSASRGNITGSPSTTNAAGDTPAVTITSTSAGPVIITASGASGTPAATLNAIFVATSADTATVQANPGTIHVTTGSASQTNNSATISVVVRDAALNLVKNAGVSFSNAGDTTGGQLLSSTGITDVTGSASVTYVAGGTSSSQNGITISATVNTIGGAQLAAPVTGSTSLTVAGQSVQVRLGTDNLVGGLAPENTKTYVAVVTDAGGNPVVGTTVQFVLRPGVYQKGFYAKDPTGTFWQQTVTATCPNLDFNFNGNLDLVNGVPGTGEDLVIWPTGVSHALLPGVVASVNGSGVTDASGVATATITYAKDHSNWAAVTLEARTTVTSNDPPTQTTFYLPGLASDYNNINVAPPGQLSPFGQDNTCADTL